MLSSVLFATPTAPVRAHASLERITPANGSVVSAPVEVVELQFDEDVTSPRITVRRNTGIVLGRTARIGGTVRFTPRTPMSKGTYSVVWRVRSADGHFISGISRFKVTTSN